MNNFLSIKPKGFTLIELIISMVLLSILFEAGMYVYVLVNNQMVAVSQKNSFYTEYHLFKQSFENDILNANKINAEQQFHTILFENETGVTQYYFDSIYILRTKKDAKDTFQISSILDKVTFYDDNTLLVSEIVIRHTFNGKQFLSVFSKNYSSCEILNFTDIAYHE